MLIAREGERALLLRHLRSLIAGEPGIVTVTGLPGVGRSTLAAAAAADLAPSGVNPVTVSLAGLDDPLGVADAVMVRLPGKGLSRTLPESLWEAFGGAPVLLLLDDVDHVEGLPGVFEELAQGYPAAIVLCTAHRPLHTDGERVVRVAAMDVPQDAAPGHPALRLFAECARSHGVDLDLEIAEVRAQVAAICRAAGGLPGAIVVAAARVGTIPLAVMAKVFLGRQGLAASLDWTNELLSKSAQRTLAQVSVFERPFLLDAAAAVIDRGPTSGDPTVDLFELLDAHVLELDPAGIGEPRFLMPEAVRGSARLRLASSEHAGAVRDRHARYFRNRGLAGADMVREEWPDIVAALDHEIRHGRLEDALARAIALAPGVQDLPGAVASLDSRISELLGRGAPVPDQLRARALLWSTTAFPGGAAADLERVGVWTAGRLADATALARQSGDGPALLEALERTVRSLRITLDLGSAIAAAHEGLDLARRLDEQRALARFECWVAMTLAVGGDHAHAARLAASAVERGRQHDDYVAITSGSLLLHTIPEGLRAPLEPPPPSLEIILEMCERHDLPFTAMNVLGALAHASLLRGGSAAAADWLWKGLMIAASHERSEPMATQGYVALLMLVADSSGHEDEAIKLRENARPLELFVPYLLPAEAVAAYHQVSAKIDATEGTQRREVLASEMAGLSVADTNRWAQRVARGIAGHHPPGQVAPPRRAHALTLREQDVLAAIASGRTNKEIAADLGMSAKTVMHHTVAIYRKLDVHGRAGATAWAYEHQLAGSDRPHP